MMHVREWDLHYYLPPAALQHIYVNVVDPMDHLCTFARYLLMDVTLWNLSLTTT